MFTQSVRNLMDPRKLILVPGTVTVREAAKLMKSKHYGAVLVTEGDALQGIFTERAAGRDPETTPVADVMTKQPKTISPEKAFGHAMLMMHEGAFRHLPVVDKGRLVGMVSSRMALDPDLEEFVFEERRRKQLLDTR